MIHVTVTMQGYDMEDAMILNKASHERGFAHATVYKSEVCKYSIFVNVCNQHFIMMFKFIDISKFGDKQNPMHFGMQLQIMLCFKLLK